MNQISLHLWNFRTIGFLLQGRKSTSFQPKRLLKTESFRLRRRWRNSSLYYRRNINLKTEVIKNRPFNAFLDIKVFLQESKTKLLIRIVLYNYRAFDWHVDCRNQTVSHAEYQVWRFSQVSIKTNFWKFGAIMILMQEKTRQLLNRLICQ